MPGGGDELDFLLGPKGGGWGWGDDNVLSLQEELDSRDRPAHPIGDAYSFFLYSPPSPASPCCLQEKLDALDCGRRFVSPGWHTWEDPEEGGAAKPSALLQ